MKTLYTNKDISNNMLGSIGPKKLVWLGDFEPHSKTWIKINKRLETDSSITEEECTQRKFVWLGGRCFAIKSYYVHRISFGTKHMMNEMDDVFIVRQYYAILR